MKCIVQGTKAAVVGRDAGTWIDLVVRNGESLLDIYSLFLKYKVWGKISKGRGGMFG